MWKTQKPQKLKKWKKLKKNGNIDQKLPIYHTV